MIKKDSKFLRQSEHLMLINKHLNLIKFWIEYLFPQNKDIDSTSNQSRPFLLFLFVIFVYSLFMIFTQPAYTLRGAMYAETATNYFTNANSDSYLDKFFATDAAYIPLPQRIIAYLGHILDLSAAIITYFYTWSAIILTAAMVGSFCLMPFRALIANDATRLLLSLCVLLMVEPSTRVFINFTYFSIFFIAVIISLAITQRSKKVPIYSWFIPFFMIS